MIVTLLHFYLRNLVVVVSILLRLTLRWQTGLQCSMMSKILSSVMKLNQAGKTWIVIQEIEYLKNRLVVIVPKLLDLQLGIWGCIPVMTMIWKRIPSLNKLSNSIYLYLRNRLVVLTFNLPIGLKLKKKNILYII